MLATSIFPSHKFSKEGLGSLKLGTIVAYHFQFNGFLVVGIKTMFRVFGENDRQMD